LLEREAVTVVGPRSMIAGQARDLDLEVRGERQSVHRVLQIAGR